METPVQRVSHRAESEPTQPFSGLWRRLCQQSGILPALSLHTHTHTHTFLQINWISPTQFNTPPLTASLTYFPLFTRVSEILLGLQCNTFIAGGMRESESKTQPLNTGTSWAVTAQTPHVLGGNTEPKDVSMKILPTFCFLLQIHKEALTHVSITWAHGHKIGSSVICPLSVWRLTFGFESVTERTACLYQRIYNNRTGMT